MAWASVQDLSASDLMKGPLISSNGDLTLEELKSIILNKEAVAVLLRKEELGIIPIERIKEFFNSNQETNEGQTIKQLAIKNILQVQATASIEDLIPLWNVLGDEGIILVEGETGPEGIIVLKDILSLLWSRLRITEAMLKSVMESVSEAITIIDENDMVIGWNYRSQSLYNIQASEILGKKINSFFTNLVVTEAKRSLKKYKDAYHKSSHNTHVLINATPVKVGEDIVGSVSSERDITETVYLHEELTKASSQVRKLEKAISKVDLQKDPFAKIIGKSKKLQNTIQMAKRVAVTDASVLIRGESGTGKELFAEAIHQASHRKDKTFVVINCGAIPGSLFESELFGYSGGAFTGADKRGKPGKFEMAHNGTIFLDEIGEMQLDMQVKLLRVLQNKVFYRVGGREPVHTDVRIIAATNRDLEKMIEEGIFRKDLYYRLNVVSLDIPNLRERKEDLAELISIFINEFSSLYSKENINIPSEIMNTLLNYSWPGNVREVRNLVERLVILTEDGAIKKEHLPEEIRVNKDEQINNEIGSKLIQETEKTERQIILKTLDECEGNKSKAARILGIPRSSLYYKLKTLNIKI